MNTQSNKISSKDRETIDFLVSLKYRDRFPIRLFSKYYPLNKEQVQFYEELLDWSDISNNKNVRMDEDFIQSYQDKLEWLWTSMRTDVNFSDEFIERHKDRFDWYVLSENPSIDFSLERIEEFKDRINWERLSNNISSINTDQILSKYQDRLDWRQLSMNKNMVFTNSLLKKFKDKWDWKLLSGNTALNINLDLISEFSDYLNVNSLFANTNISDIEDIIKKYGRSLNWSVLSSNSVLPLSKEFIARYGKLWDWSRLSSNPSLPPSIGLLESFVDEWDWDSISRNKSILINEDIIRRFKDRWCWFRVSEYIAFELSEDFIIEFAEYWEWKNIIANPNFPMTQQILDQYKDLMKNYYGISSLSNTGAFLKYMGNNNSLKEVDWGKLSKNSKHTFDFKTFLKYEQYWNYDKLIYNSEICGKVIGPHLNDLVVFEVMESYRDAKDRRYLEPYSLTVAQKEIACIELAKAFINNEIIEDNDYYAKLAQSTNQKQYNAPQEKSFSELWKMYGFEGSGIGHQIAGVLTYGHMEECMYRWFEILYDRSTKELDKVEEESRMARGRYLQKARDMGVRINLGPSIFYLAEDIQRGFGNYG